MARPKLGESESKRLQMVITEDELAAIDDWQFENRIPSRSDAIRRLVQIGLRLDRHAEALYEETGKITALGPQVEDHLRKALNSEQNAAYDARVAVAFLSGFLNQSDSQNRVLSILYGLLGEAALLRDEPSTARAIKRADEAASEYYKFIDEVVRPLSRKWEEEK